MENIIAEVTGAGAVVIAVAGVVVGAVFSYLFLRTNPDKKAVLDEEVEKISDELKGK